jgi:hypothetical protein
VSKWYNFYRVSILHLNTHSLTQNIRHRRRQPLIIYVALSSLIACLCMFIYFGLRSRNIPQPKPTTTASSSTKGSQPAQQHEDNASSQDSAKNPTGNPSRSSSFSLVTPTGDFVSNHHPNLSGNPYPNSMSSVCETSPGASCKIVFTNSETGATKELSTQTADAGGAAYWDWKLQDIGLTEGTWKINAVAVSGSQTQSARDPMDLEVGS